MTPTEAAIRIRFFRVARDISAKVHVNTTATAGSFVSRLVTITSLGHATRRDAVTFTVNIAGP